MKMCIQKLNLVFVVAFLGVFTANASETPQQRMARFMAAAAQYQQPYGIAPQQVQPTWQQWQSEQLRQEQQQQWLAQQQLYRQQQEQALQQQQWQAQQRWQQELQQQWPQGQQPQQQFFPQQEASEAVQGHGEQEYWPVLLPGGVSPRLQERLEQRQTKDQELFGSIAQKVDLINELLGQLSEKDIDDIMKNALSTALSYYETIKSQHYEGKLIASLYDLNRFNNELGRFIPQLLEISERIPAELPVTPQRGSATATGSRADQYNKRGRDTAAAEAAAATGLSVKSPFQARVTMSSSSSLPVSSSTVSSEVPIPAFTQRYNQALTIYNKLTKAVEAYRTKMRNSHQKPDSYFLYIVSVSLYDFEKFQNESSGGTKQIKGAYDRLVEILDKLSGYLEDISERLNG